MRLGSICVPFTIRAATIPSTTTSSAAAEPSQIQIRLLFFEAATRAFQDWVERAAAPDVKSTLKRTRMFTKALQSAHRSDGEVSSVSTGSRSCGFAGRGPMPLGDHTQPYED